MVGIGSDCVGNLLCFEECCCSFDVLSVIKVFYPQSHLVHSYEELLFRIEIDERAHSRDNPHVYPFFCEKNRKLATAGNLKKARVDQKKSLSLCCILETTRVFFPFFAATATIVGASQIRVALKDIFF